MNETHEFKGGCNCGGSADTVTSKEVITSMNRCDMADDVTES